MDDTDPLMPVDREYQREREREDQFLLALARYGASTPGFVPEPIDVRALRAPLVLLNLIDRNSQVALRLLRKRPA